MLEEKPQFTAHRSRWWLLGPIWLSRFASASLSATALSVGDEEIVETDVVANGPQFQRQSVLKKKEKMRLK